MIKSLISATALVVSLTTFAQNLPLDRSQWTMNDYWEDTQIDFQVLVYGTINPNLCTSGVKKFLGCLAAINKIYELSNPDKMILVKYDTSNFENENTSTFKTEEFTGISSQDFFEIKKAYFKNLYQRLNSLDSALKLARFNAEKILNKFSTQVVTKANDQMMASKIINQYFSVAKDPHTSIRPTKYIQDRSKPTQRKKGIGIAFFLDKYQDADVLVLKEIIPNSPAKSSGLQAGDIILKANKADKADTIYEVIMKQDFITFEVLRNDQVITINLQKGFYETKNVQASILKRDGINYGYIRLLSFIDNTACSEIKKQGLKMIQNDSIKGLILDLRNNGGGYVAQAQCITALYLEDYSRSWVVDYLDDNSSVLLQYKNKKTDNIFGNIHTVTLINGNSASASEATAMYLKDYRKSFIVGERSFGKGSMQIFKPIKVNPKVLKASTQALYYGPKGISPQGVGVKPDFTVYPKFTQTEASKYKRESDRYLLFIENKITQDDLEHEDRKEEIKVINDCINDRNKVSTLYQRLTDSQKMIFDNQLEKSLEVIRCANENVDIYSDININTLKDSVFLNVNQYIEMLKRQ